ncbi:MAG TPA: adenosyl-hopene transferase HpnH [Candidatus Acidoferrum sp.]|nr:adenosyl-hopene transferase HpnH [Candidatus Acidoferrum sp.]
MRYPLGLVLDSARYLASRKLRGDKKIPVMLSLDPLGGCASTNGGANGNGAKGNEKRGMLSVEQCLAAMKECDTPIVAISGGEPLEYPEIARLSREILERGKHLFLCTDGALIRRRLHMIPPYTNFFWNVKLDGTEAAHDGRASRPGLFAEALDGVKAAKNAGFFVVVTTTIYPDSDVRNVASLYEQLHALHVDGYMLSPHYPARQMCRNSAALFHEKMRQRFREAGELLSEYNLLTSPVYLEYLRGERELDCCAWGSPVYGPQGWAAPCKQLNQSYEQEYRTLLDKTVWENFGRGMNPRCEPCSSHAGYETAAILGMNPKAGDFWKMIAWQLQGGLGEKRERVRKS